MSQRVSKNYFSKQNKTMSILLSIFEKYKRKIKITLGFSQKTEKFKQYVIIKKENLYYFVVFF